MPHSRWVAHTGQLIHVLDPAHVLPHVRLPTAAHLTHVRYLIKRKKGRGISPDFVNLITGSLRRPGIASTTPTTVVEGCPPPPQTPGQPLDDKYEYPLPYTQRRGFAPLLNKGAVRPPTKCVSGDTRNVTFSAPTTATVVATVAAIANSAAWAKCSIIARGLQGPAANRSTRASTCTQYSFYPRAGPFPQLRDLTTAVYASC